MKPFSMRSNLLITIVAMGLLGVVFTLFTGEIYLQKTLQNRQETFNKLIELEVHHRWNELKKETASLGLSIQSSSGFKTAYNSKDIAVIENSLNGHFNRAFVTLGILDLKKLIIYDVSLKKTFQSSKGGETNVCPSILAAAKTRIGYERFKALHQVCEINGELRLLTLVAVGGLRLKGYLLVIVDPLVNLVAAEEGLGIPLLIKNSKEKELFKSNNWPNDTDIENIMFLHYGDKAGNKNPVANFYFASDVTDLKNDLDKTRIELVAVVFVIILLAMMISLFMFRKTIIIPLDNINTYMKKIRQDRRYLDEELQVSGNAELHDLATEMNGLNHDLSRLYIELEEMVFTDSLTGIPNRALLFDRLKQMMLFSGRDKAHSEFMLMMMDLNKFKAVNDTLGHHIGDELLIAVASRLKQALRSADTVARLGGDEFAIILYAVNEKEVAESIASKITLLMSDDFVIDGHVIDVSLSIGISRFPKDGNTSGKLMHCADMAMYHSKRNKLPYVFYDKTLGG